MDTLNHTTNGSLDLYRKVRGGLVAKGTNLSRWAMEHGLKRENVRRALLGLWTGTKACEVRHMAMGAAGIVANAHDNERFVA